MIWLYLIGGAVFLLWAMSTAASIDISLRRTSDALQRQAAAAERQVQLSTEVNQMQQELLQLSIEQAKQMAASMKGRMN